MNKSKTSPLNIQWAKMMVVAVVFFALIANVKTQCSPDPTCNDGDPCTIDECVGTLCSNIEKPCDDLNPCTVDSCVDGECVFSGVCSSGSATPAPSPSTTPPLTIPSSTKQPNVDGTQSSSSTPQLAPTTASPSFIPVIPSTASPLISLSATSSGGVPTGFPIQSSSATFLPSATSTISISQSSSPSAAVTNTPSTSFIPSASSSTSFSPSNLPPSATPSAIPASPLPFRLGAPSTVLVQLQCSGDCCANFTGAWAALVDINSEYLMDILTCDLINSNLVSITYNQFGSNFHNLYEILHAYWVRAGCGSFTFDDEGPCFPNQGYLSSSNWEGVIEIAFLSGDYVSTLTTDYSTDGLTYITQPALSSTSSASVLLPSFFLLFSFFLF